MLSVGGTGSGVKGEVSPFPPVVSVSGSAVSSFLLGPGTPPTPLEIRKDLTSLILA